MLESFQSLQQLRPRLRKVADQPDVVAKADQEGSVFRPQNIFQKDFQVALMFLGKVFLAAADVDNQSQRQGKVNAPGKKGNLLLHGVFKYLNVVLGEVVYQSAVRVADGETNVYQIHGNPHRLSILAKTAHRGRQQKQDQRHRFGHLTLSSRVLVFTTRTHPNTAL